MSTGVVPRRGSQSAFFLFLVSVSGVSWPAEDSGDGNASAGDSTVIITASRAPEDIDDSFWSSTVLTRKDIESRQATSVQDLLAGLAGVEIDNTGGLGKTSSVFLRGTNADQTLVLIDGVRVGSATLGTAALEHIPVAQIDRIEVVRGPRSTLYGSDAMGGVIQIFTHRDGPQGLTLGGSAMTGSHDTHDFTADLQARGERFWGSISGDTLTTRGINSCLPGAATAGTACFLDHPNLNPDGYHNHSLNVAAGGHVGGGLTVEVSQLLTDGWTDYDGGFVNNTQFAQRVTTLSLDEAVTPAWHVRLIGGHDVDVSKDFLDNTFGDRFDTTRNTGSLQVDGKVTSAVRLISGFDYQHDHVDALSSVFDPVTGAESFGNPFAVTSRSTKGVFSEVHAAAGAWSGLAGARFEDNDQFGHHTTESLGVTRKLGEHHRLLLTWGTAFHGPSFNELYFPGFGNPNLTPEKSKSVEAGVDGVAFSSAAPLRWSVHVYETKIDSLIAYDATSALAQNIDQGRIRGAELQADWHTRAWKIGGQLTGMQPLNLSNDSNHGNLLPRRARQNGSLEVRRFLTRITGFGLSQGSVAALTRWQGRRFDDLANRLPMGSYLTVDLLTEWTIAREWQLQACAANLFDRSYQTAAYYAQDGRHYALTVRYQFGGK